MCHKIKIKAICIERLEMFRKPLVSPLSPPSSHNMKLAEYITPCRFVYNAWEFLSPPPSSVPCSCFVFFFCADVTFCYGPSMASLSKDNTQPVFHKSVEETSTATNQLSNLLSSSSESVNYLSQ